LTRLLGQKAEAERWFAQARQRPLRTARDHYLVATEHAVQGRFRQALPLLRHATEQDPQNFWAWFILGICHDRLAQDAEATACYSTCIALWPEYPWSFFNRGLANLRQQDFPQACTNFDRAIRLRPDLAEPYINRALARHGMGNYAGAIQDLTHALELGAPYTRIYFMRARVREKAGDRDGAQRDREEGLRRFPADEHSWVARGVARLPREPEAALADFDQALALNPRSLAALQNKAHVLADKPGRLEEAIAVLNQAVALYPDYVAARSGRGVLHARLGQREAALQDAEESLRRDTKPATLYQVAGIYAQTSPGNPDDRRQALQLLSSALRKGFGIDLLDKDTDLDPIRDDAEFQRLASATRDLYSRIPSKQPE
jgi:tetratricopeptide (TPR) repeat protein